MTYKPPTVDGSTLPSWVKLPVETHEPNTSGAPIKESTTNAYSSTLMMSKPTTLPSTPDIDVIMTSNSIETNNSSTQSPSSTLSMVTPTIATTTTDSFETGNTPLNMSNYKDGKRQTLILCF